MSIGLGSTISILQLFFNEYCKAIEVIFTLKDVPINTNLFGGSEVVAAEELGFQICIDADGSSFNVVAERAGCKLTLPRVGKLDESEC